MNITRMGPRLRQLVRISLLVACVCLPAAAAVRVGFETVPARPPGELLPAWMVSGPNFHVLDPVHGDGLMDHFVVVSRFGDFDAYGRAALAIRIHEIAALTELSRTSDIQVAAGGAVQGAESEVKTATRVVTHPVQIITGIPRGIAHLFSGYKARGEELAGDARSGAKSLGGGGGSGGARSAGNSAVKAARSYAKRYLGITAAERAYYRKLAVDPYTDNKVLRDAIRRDARISAGASFGMKFAGLAAIPGIGIAQRAVNEIYNEDPAVIRQRTRKTLAGLGLRPAEIERFMNAPLLSPTRQVVLLSAVKALHGVDQRGELIRHAIGLKSDEEVQVYLRSVELLVKANERRPVGSVLPGVRLPAARRPDGSLVVCGAFESVYWTRRVARLESQLRSALPKTAPGTERELWIAGTMSRRARRAARELGWVVHEVPEEAPAEPVARE